MRRRSTAESYDISEPTPTGMCDACGTKLRFYGKKVCQYCQRQFCQNCLMSSPSTTRSFQTCKSCDLHHLDVIERSHLLSLSLADLKYYARCHNIQTPLTIDMEQLIDLILTRQANTLADRTKIALRQVLGPNEAVDVAHRLLQEPYVSTYSMGGARSSSTLVEEREVPGGWQYVVTGDGTGGGGRDGLRGAPGMEGHGTGNGGIGRGHVEAKRSLNGLPATEVRGPVSSSGSSVDVPELDVSQATSLDAVTNVHQIHSLSVKQLKLFLQQNCINYKGCVEKEELQVRVKRLWQAKEDERIKVAALAQAGDIDAESSYLCKICMDSPVDCVLLECGHMLSCVKCGRQLAECPVCRQYVSRVVHAFRV